MIRILNQLHKAVVLSVMHTLWIIQNVVAVHRAQSSKHEGVVATMTTRSPFIADRPFY